MAKGAKLVRAALVGAILASCAAPLHAGQPQPQAAAGSADPAAQVLDKQADEAVRLLQAGEYDQAEQLLRTVLAGREKLLGPDHPDSLLTANYLGVVYREVGRYPEAEALHRRALAGAERALGPDHRVTLQTVNYLAALMTLEGKFAAAEPLYLRAIAGSERVVGPDARLTISTMNNLALLYSDQGQYRKAEQLYLDVIQRWERSVGPDDPDAITAVGNLATLYDAQGRHVDSEPLHARVLRETERHLGADHPDTITALNNLANSLHALERTAEAEPLFLRAARAAEAELGPDHPRTLTLLYNLASLYQDAERYSEAEPLIRRVLASGERNLGPDAEATISSMRRLADILDLQGRYAEAKPLYLEAVSRFQRTFGANHPYTLAAIRGHLIAELDQPAGTSAALGVARDLVAGLRQRGGQWDRGQAALRQRERESLGAARGYALLADAALHARPASATAAAAPSEEVFAVLQDAIAGSADRAIAEQVARRSVSDNRPNLATLLLERAGLQDEWDRLDDQLVASVQTPPEERTGPEPSAIRTEIAALDQRIEAIDAQLRAEAPDYFALIRPGPLTIAAAQRLLGPDELVIMTVPGVYGTHLVAVSRERVLWKRSAWTADQVKTAVERLRRQLGAPVAAPDAPAEAAGTAVDASFDRATAHALYRQLISPLASELQGKRRIYIAAGGSLAALPFTVLVSARPSGSDSDPAALRATRWFGDDFALVHVPSLQSLGLLRQNSAGRSGSRFVGIGDPLLEGEPVARTQQNAGRVTGIQNLFKGDSRDGGLVADVSELRSMHRLPGSAVELRAVRAAFDAPRSMLLMGAQATEPAVRAANLSDVSVLLFSTHGLTATQATGVGQAGLVLTPPPPGEERDGDDGFLAASEVASLRLAADWVILSACNTAVGDGTEPAGLGSLARSFFFAGARSLLASHWPVSDAIAPILVPRMLALERRGVDRAEAFRRAMGEVRRNRSHDRAGQSWAHPFYWAPFVLIGDGRR